MDLLKARIVRGCNNKENNIWSPVFYTQEVLNQNHATDLLHEMVDKETPRAFTAVGVLITHLKTTKTRTLRYDQ